ncbi:hypothetical protein, partial [Staphylococcus aureus]
GTGSAAFTENGVAVAVAPSATVADPDSADFAGGRLIVFFSANGTPDDRLGLLNQGSAAGQVGVSGNVGS